MLRISIRKWFSPPAPLLACAVCSGILLGSCVSLMPPAYDIRQMNFEKRRNGYLLALDSKKKIDDVEAFVSGSNWLIITLPGARVDTANILSTKRFGIFGEVETRDFGSSVQISVKLDAAVDRVEVVRDPSSDAVLINVLTASGN